MRSGVRVPPTAGRFQAEACVPKQTSDHRDRHAEGSTAKEDRPQDPNVGLTGSLKGAQTMGIQLTLAEPSCDGSQQPRARGSEHVGN